MQLSDALPELLRAIPNPFAKSDHDLIVLRVTLTLAGGAPQIVFDLTGFGKIGEQSRRTWRLGFAEINVPESLNPDTVRDGGGLTLPLQLKDGLKAGIAAMNPAANLPLWLDLVRPYGFLGILPWERVLGESLERPVLRLPDFLLRPRENTDILESAILFDPPQSIGAAGAIAQIKLLTDELLAGSPRAQNRVHVFANAICLEALSSVSFDKRIRVHKHAAPDKPGYSPGDPWFGWMCAALDKRSLDAVHFVCRSRATEDAAVLLLSSSPFSREPQALTAYDVGDVGNALIRLGAWAAMFSPPPGEADGPAMAFVADTFAQSRPGSVLFHRAETDCARDLRESYKVLFSVASTRAPRLSKGFLYCQPTTVDAHAGLQIKIASEALPAEPSELSQQASWIDRARAKAGVYIPALGVDLEQAPNWASAARRYVESASLNQLRRASTDVLFTKSGEAFDRMKSVAQSDTVQKTLSDIQDIVGKYVNKPLK